MRDINRIRPFLDELEQMWLKVPDWRFGQLISNVFTIFDGHDNAIFNCEDDKMLEIFKNYFK